MFVCNIDDQQSNPVCSHTDNLACSTCMVLIISSFSEIVNVMCLVIRAAVCLFIFCPLGAIIIAQWVHWIPDYKMWNHRISMYAGRSNIRASGIKGCFPQLLNYHYSPSLWFTGVHITCYLEYAASTINAGSTGIRFHFTDKFYLFKHLV